MRSPRFLFLLLAVGLSLAFALLRPLPGRAAPTPIRKRHLTASHHMSRSLRRGLRVVQFARHLLGVPYRYGGTSPRSGFDCSGFVRYVYAHFGISLGHSSFSDLVRGRRVSRRALEPGDLVFFDGGGHVGIYIGRGRFIHAPHTGTVVTIQPIRGWYSQRFVGARRIY
jgi:cell wall-associated NlpC family hydrolase